MKKQEATAIIRNTFENKFDKEQFDFFIRNLLKENYKKKEFSYQGNIIPQAYQGFVNKLERFGQYVDNDDNVLDVLAVRLDKKHSIHQARVSQRNFIRWYLNGSRGGELKDGALVAFYLENSDEWRFSFVKMQYSLEKQKDEFTPAKRYSYLVGKDEGSHTAQTQLLPLLQNDEIPTLKELEKAFSIGKVTNRFFEQYKELYLQLKETIDNALMNDPKAQREFETKNIKSVDFAKKTLGQIVFLYFLQKKGWLGVKKDQKWGQGDKHFLTSLYNTCIDKGQNFFNDYLKYLFYDALANERKESDDNPKDYYKRFAGKIPFLNGGLFEPTNEYDWRNINLIIPNNIFSNNTLIAHDEEGTGILDVFKRYNFTVKEDEPLDIEVAVDPEMLGKVFENLLEVTDRKSKGAFYTPREIVHYMCQESLINYLDTKLNKDSAVYKEFGSKQSDLFDNTVKKGQLSLETKEDNIIISKEDIEIFIRKGTLILENEQHVENLQKETKTYNFKLPETIRNNAKKIDKVLENVKICDPAIGSGAFPVGLLHEIVTARQVINTYLKNDISTYELKRNAIYESIYGVDIEHSAVDIAKLRLWLSLVVDEENYEDIKPLPNLDYKIVCGNSLIGLPQDIMRDGELEQEIEKLKEKYFNITDKQQKHDLRIEINSKIKQLIKSAEQFISYRIDFDFSLWFSEVFRENKGFDIVIGNPPYIQLQKNGGKLANLFKTLNFETFERMGDIYALFYEKSINILTKNGILAFITSNKWMRAGYGKSLRKFLSKKEALKLIDLGPGVFETATVDTNILILKNNKTSNLQLKALALNDKKEKPLENLEFTTLNKLSEKSWVILSPIEQRIKEKIERVGKPLKDWDIDIYRGVLTGYNEAFIINGQKREELIKKDPKSAEIIRPILRGRDIKKYKAEFADLWLINTHNGVKNEGIKRINIEDYPAIKQHLDKYYDKLKKRTDKGDTPYNLRNCAYMEDFFRPKIVYPNMTKFLPFYYDENNYVTNQKCFIITGKNIAFLTAFLNSSLFKFVYRDSFPELQGGTRELSKIFFQEIFIINVSEKINNQLKTKILQIQELKQKRIKTKKPEIEIDNLIFKLYNLSEKEKQKIGYIEII